MSLPPSLQDAWHDAFTHVGESIDIGRNVVCDSCSTDYTDSPDSGGFIFGSYGYCPRCASKHLAQIIEFGEAHYIRARCPDGVSFADFIRAYRGPAGNKIRVRKL